MLAGKDANCEKCGSGNACHRGKSVDIIGKQYGPEYEKEATTYHSYAW